MNFCKSCKQENNSKYGKLFCSRSCSASFNNKGVRRHGTEHRATECLFCGKQTRPNKQYCSSGCVAKHNSEKQYKLIEKKLLSGEEITTNNAITYMKKKYSNCFCCGLGKIWNEKPLTLQLDHIDGNSDNNTLNNLRLLCPNCHTQTETFCHRNVKNTKRNTYLRKYKGDESKSKTLLLHSKEQGALP